MPVVVDLGGIRVIGRFPDANVITATKELGIGGAEARRWPESGTLTQ